jgi:hypothetical protein
MGNGLVFSKGAESAKQIGGLLLAVPKERSLLSTRER